MFLNWLKGKPAWPIDPGCVEFGSLAQRADGANRTHVLARWKGDSIERCVPVGQFLSRVQTAIRLGETVRIERLRIAPVAFRNHRNSLKNLTDWDTVKRNALRRLGHAEARLDSVLRTYHID